VIDDIVSAVRAALLLACVLALACSTEPDDPGTSVRRDAGADVVRDGGAPSDRDGGARVRDGGTIVAFDAERLARALATHLRACTEELTPAFPEQYPSWFAVAYDEDAWTEALTAYYDWADQSSRVDVDLERYAECLEGHLMRPTCEDTFRTIAACTVIFVGRQREDGACAQDIECAPGTHCARDFTVDCGTCRPWRQENDPCGVERCATGLTCDNDRCVPITPPVVMNVGDPCDRTQPNPCGTARQRFGARCIMDRCTVPTFSMAGGPCVAGNSTELCLDEGYKIRCSTNVNMERGTCELLPGPGQPCRFGSACNLFEARCDTQVGTCQPVSHHGEACAESSDCSWGLHCGNRRTCAVGPTVPPFCPG
jgi:hypothetical protein